ncbi:MAG: hypothetical protein CSB48_02290 [Proteobacteria bacterium]|nr:MAG: hypothetical protein CSB48_02290 [Pseudomonadota bacterium]
MSDSNPDHLFRIYHYYRVVISLILAGSLLLNVKGIPGSYRNEEMYQYCIIAYCAFNIFIALLLLAGIRTTSRQITISVILDLIFLHFFMFFSTGLSSGMANLVIIAVGAGNILVRGAIGTLLAAFAALSTLALVVYPILNAQEGAGSIIKAGILGIIYFAAAFILQNITRRISSSEKLAQKRAQDVAELESLNHQIIQRMQTGIVVCNEFGNIRLINQAAAALAFPSTEPPKVLPHEIQERLDHWRLQPDIRTPPFKPDKSKSSVQANFTRLEKETGYDIIVFLEDTSKVAQQAQQLKLASLGRLTAGIAHEIRNPLGAISHAAQLLAESTHLDKADLKLTDIILRHGNRVNGIIENVLQLSRRKQPETEMLELNRWILEFSDNYIAAGTRNAHIDVQAYQTEAWARFDPSQLEQILTNLFENGLRYSLEETGAATLTVKVAINPDSERCYLDIVDQGAGIKSEHQTHIFEPFFTTDSRGTGLGLYLSKELCEANQAQLDYINDGNAGSTFRITFAHHKRIAWQLDYAWK